MFLDSLLRQSLLLELAALAAGLANAGSAAAYAVDKSAARRQRRRTPEWQLLVWTLLGPFGAWVGLKLFRHKTKKPRFRLFAIGGLLLQGLCAYSLLAGLIRG